MKIQQLLLSIKKIDYRHYINVLITLGFVAFGIFLFPNAICRVVEGLRDLLTSFLYYTFSIVLGDSPIPSTVNSIARWQIAPSKFQPLKLLPISWDDFVIKWGEYWRVWSSLAAVQEYLELIGDIIYNVSRFLAIILPVALFLKIQYQEYLEQHNVDYDKESKGLQSFENNVDSYVFPVLDWVLEYVDFLRTHSYWIKLWIGMWAFYFNIITIVIEFVAFYLYFAIDFDLLCLYIQLYKLLLDLSPMIRFIPAFLWIIIGIIALESFSRRRGMQTLEHRERKNCGFLGERGVMTIVYGPMGAGKTKLITDMALSEETRQRNMAFEIIVECDFKFPQMNWATFEQDFKSAINRHEVFSIATVNKFIDNKQEKFFENPIPENIWGYKFERYGLEYDDKLKVENVWDVIRDYACAYFIYTITSSLLVTNYSIRVDNLLEDMQNFPQWNTSFFKRDSRLMESYSRHSHILDFDMLRLGKRLLKDNPNRYAFGFGVYVISEIDKERKNTVELSAIKSTDKECNQKNDLFNALVKMSRHRCVVANRVFVRFFADLQRPESLGADARELGEIIYIEDSGKMSPCLPFFAPFYFFYALFTSSFVNIVSSYYTYRFYRGDKTLPMYFVKSISAKLKHFCDRTCNLYGSSVVILSVESGRMDGERKEYKYYLQSKKIYSLRYATNCLMGIFAFSDLMNTVGINDLEEYKTERGSDDENLKQNSHFQVEVHQYN